MSLYQSVSACVVLINKNGLVLGVSRKDNHKDFGLPGGKMELIDNNDPMVTAIRECKEETGINVSNLRLVFATHKNGNMGFTYLADYDGEINHNEPHIVKWVPFQILINGRFGKYNKMVSESLSDMGVKHEINIDEDSMTKEVEAYFKVMYDGKVLFSHFYKNISYNGVVNYEIYVDFPDSSELDDWGFGETFDVSESEARDLELIGEKYGISLTLSSDYFIK